MRREADIPVGATVRYEEDGAVCLCQILASEVKDGYLRLKLVAVENGSSGHIGGFRLKGIPEGDIFDVEQAANPCQLSRALGHRGGRKGLRGVSIRHRALTAQYEMTPQGFCTGHAHRPRNQPEPVGIRVPGGSSIPRQTGTGAPVGKLPNGSRIKQTRPLKRGGIRFPPLSNERAHMVLW